MDTSQFSFDALDSLLDSAVVPVSSTSGASHSTALTVSTLPLSQSAHGESPSLAAPASLWRVDTGGGGGVGGRPPAVQAGLVDCQVVMARTWGAPLLLFPSVEPC